MWQSFYSIIGAAAATLTGLMFVSTTLYAGIRMTASSARAGLEAFATPTIVHFGSILLVSALLTAPWQALWHASLLFAIVGLGGIALVVIAVRWEHRQTQYRAKLSDWVWYRSLPVVSYVALIVAAFLLPVSPAPALFLIAAVMLALLLTGIRNAWDSVTYLAIEHGLGDTGSQD